MYGVSWWQIDTVILFLASLAAEIQENGAQKDDHREVKKVNSFKRGLDVVLLACEPWIEPMGPGFFVSASE